MLLKEFFDKEFAVERNFNIKKQYLVDMIEKLLLSHCLSDHGMIEYLLDLWEHLGIAYQARMSFC